MHRRLSLLCVLSLSALLSPCSVFAEDAPATPPAPIGQTALTPAPPQTPAPAPTAPSAAAPVARKEEEEVKIRSGFFAGLFPGKSISKEQAADEITRLRAENADLRKQLDAANTELQAIAADWPAIREALMAGKPDAPVLQKPLGQQVMQATAAAAAAEAGKPGHNPAQLPGPGAAKPEGKAAESTGDKKGHQLIAGHFAAQGWQQPGLN